MTIQIYNSLTRKKEQLIPLKDDVINMYSCGVTVYDKCHIGHARSLYVFEVVTNYLKSKGYKVKFVRNITDIDDKIINRAKELSKTWEDVSIENIQKYKKDLIGLELNTADYEPHATENITEMITHIEGLIDKGYAYEINGDVYFRVRAFKDYGKLSKQSVDKMLEAVRIDEDEKKEDPLDFALWKKSKAGESFWDSPWGNGRPGWHIECSVMSMKYLSCETLDIHAGGRDLIFPHHENEIAQSEALTGKPFAKYWIHHGLLTINGQKMSKSLGNFITVEEALSKYDADDLKIFFLTSHYRSAIDFTEEKIWEAKKHKNSFNEFFDKAYTWLQIKNPVTQITEKDKIKIETAAQKFSKAMDDDFNTPEALASMFELIDLGSKYISMNNKEAIQIIFDHLVKFFTIFGLSVRKKIEITDEVKKLINQRSDAKKNKDFKKADEIRLELKEKFNLMAVDTSGGIAFIGGEDHER